MVNTEPVFENYLRMKPQITVKKRTVRSFIAGDPGAFRKVYDAYQGKLFAYSLKFTKSASDAEEVVQRSFIRLWEFRHNIDPHRPFDPYVYRIARNCAFDYLKEAARTARLKDDLRLVLSTSSYYQDSPSADAYIELAQQAIQMLPEKRQIIFRMSYDEDMTHEQIAETLQLSVHTVKSQLVKATKFLRLHLLQRVTLLALSLFSL
jgi:RNA polymerase sigma-70 factor (ECF subfamily)